MMETLPLQVEGSGPVAVATRSLEKRYGGLVALAGVELTVPEGAVYVLVGPNGVGKTTTFKVLVDLVVADSGRAEVLGLDTRRHGARVRAQVGYVPERDDLPYGWIRVGALMRYHAAYYPSWDARYAGELMRQFEVQPGSRIGALSKGQQRRVQLLLALAHRPPVLLLDEPLDALDPLMRDQAMAVLAAHLAHSRTTILISTHHVQEAERLADWLGVMHGGRLEAQVGRDTLRRKLRRYHFRLSDAWAGAPSLGDTVIRRTATGREAAWTIWGEESEVTEQLNGAGVTVRNVEPLTLEAAAVALLARHARNDTAPNDSVEPAHHLAAV